MNSALILKIVRSVPFRAFTMKLNDGQEFYVAHPELTAVDLGFVFVIDDKSQRGIYLEPRLIATLQVDEKVAS